MQVIVMKEVLKKFYEEKYKILMFVPFVLFCLAVVVILLTKANYGDIVQKDVSLSGGISYDVRISDWHSKSSSDVLSLISEKNPDNTYDVIELRNFGEKIGFSLMADVDNTDESEFEILLRGILDEVFEDDYTIVSQSSMGATIANDFFRTTFRFLFTAFILMGVVVFLYFRKTVPSLAVIFSAIADIVITIGIFDLLEMKLSMAGVAAILMLVGYSVDTDILLTTKLIKEKPKDIQKAIYSAMRTGLKMSLTTMFVVLFVYFISQAPSIKQIMMILFIGLIVDVFSTWFMNAGILKLYLEKRMTKKGVNK